MTRLVKQRKYELADYIENNFSLFINTGIGTNHTLHIHDFTELVIVERGKGIHFTETFRHRITAGDVLVIPKGLKHGYENAEMLKITNIIFDMSLFDSFPNDFKHISGFYSLFLLNPLQQKRIVNKKGFLTLEPEEIVYVKQLINRASRELREKCTGYQSVCVIALADLIVFLSRKASKHNLVVHTKGLADVLCYMEKNYNQNISLEQLSRMVSLSPRSFQRIFHNYMGTNPFSHLINLRIQHAKKMLEETELNISEIAYATGFGNSAYFTRQFKKIFCVPPLCYRKQVRVSD